MVADPLLLLHPFPMDARFWGPLVAVLDTDREVLTHELPGFGAAPPSPGWSIRGAAQSIAHRIAGETPNGRAVIVGLSMGGYVALALVNDAPERVAALVLADTRAEADAPAAHNARAGAIASIREHGSQPFLGDLVPHLLSPRVADTTKRRVIEISSEQRQDTFIAALQALRDRPDRTAELSKIRVPTLVIVGDDDAVTPPEAAVTLANRIPGAELTVIPEAGHLCAIEQPAAFADALGRFVRDL